MSIRLYPINVKTAEPIGPKICVWLHMTPGKVYEWSKFQVFYFCKILKMREKLLWNPQTFVCFCFILYKENMLTDKTKIRSWNRRWARSALKPSYIILYRITYYIFFLLLRRGSAPGHSWGEIMGRNSREGTEYTPPAKVIFLNINFYFITFLLCHLNSFLFYVYLQKKIFLKMFFFTPYCLSYR